MVKLVNFPTIGSQLPTHEIVERFVITSGARRGVWYALRCPRKHCRGHFDLRVKDLKVSRFLTRPCPHCMATAVLPEKLHRFAAKPQ